MRRTIFSLAMALMSVTLMAVDTQFLPISVVVGDMVEPFPAGAKALMENKLTQVLTRNGIAGIDYQGQFVLTAVTVPLDKDVIPGPPAKISEKMELSLYIVDALNRTIFSSTSMTVRGLGENENKCYMNALSRMPIQSEQLAKFVAEGKEKIVSYYDAKGPQMIQKAQTLARMKQFEEALNILMMIPEECKHYNDALAASLAIYQQYLDNECNKNLAAAHMAWAAEQNSMGAEKAGQFLGQILPDAACYGDAMALYKEIKGKVLDDWKFEMKVYQDGVDIEKQRIQAMRDIGVAYGQNQPKETYHFDFIPRWR